MAKPTPDQMWNTEFFQQHANAALERAQESLRDQLTREFRQSLLMCESPLEAAFAAWWSASIWLFFANMCLDHQVEVVAGGEKFRLDLVVSPAALGAWRKLFKHPACPKLAIELDGHDFHERTKAQVDRRNARDRALQLAGWTVWHVSGSEFHRDPYACIGRVKSDAAALYVAALEQINVPEVTKADGI